jgi:hypothetical protein
MKYHYCKAVKVYIRTEQIGFLNFAQLYIGYLASVTLHVAIKRADFSCKATIH